MNASFHSLILYLHNERGHNYSYNLSVEEAVRKWGIGFHAYVPMSCILQLPGNWKRFFRKGLISQLLDFIKFFRRKNGRRFVLLEAFNFIDLCQFILASFFFAKKQDTLLLLFRSGFPRKAYKRWIFSIPIKIWLLKMGKRVVFLTDSALIPEEVAQLFSRECHVMPIPHTRIPPEMREKRGQLNCYWPGQPHPRKGQKEIEKLLSIQGIKNQQIEISLAEDAPFSFPQNGIKLRHVKSVLSQDEYFKELFRTDVVLLPYDPVIHQKSTSGIFVEAIVAGKFPLVKSGTWMAQELKNHSLQELIVEWENPYFFTHLIDLYHNERVKQKISRMQEDYSNFHTIERYSYKLKEIAKKHSFS